MRVGTHQSVGTCMCWSPNWNEPHIGMGTPQFGILTYPYPYQYGAHSNLGTNTYMYQRSDEYQHASSSAINEAQNITIR